MIEQSCEYDYQDFMDQDFMETNLILDVPDSVFCSYRDSANTDLEDVDYLDISPSLPVCPPWYVHALFAICFCGMRAWSALELFCSQSCDMLILVTIPSVTTTCFLHIGKRPLRTLLLLAHSNIF
jgi:hypothetical protein